MKVKSFANTNLSVEVGYPIILMSNMDQFVDIEFHFVSGSPASDGGRQIRKAHGISDTMWQMYRPLAYR